ncbi:MAG TPA: hypothetical protein VMW10_08340, partial [Alphaproteobacteria bacterium]|nr:hypothetical protein [Alphaproteobacteria bacterium]
MDRLLKPHGHTPLAFSFLLTLLPAEGYPSYPGFRRPPLPSSHKAYSTGFVEAGKIPKHPERSIGILTYLST